MQASQPTQVAKNLRRVTFGETEYHVLRSICPFTSGTAKTVHIYSAWRRSEGLFSNDGHTVRFIQGRLHVQVGTDPDRKVYNHLPQLSQERSDAYDQALSRRAALARSVILAAHPELAESLPANHSGFASYELVYLANED